MSKDTLKKAPDLEEQKAQVNTTSDKKSTPEKHGDYTANIVRDYYGNADPFYLSQKVPGYEYRFLREENKNLSAKTGNLLYQKGGWQLCQKEHLMKLVNLGAISEREISPDGLYRKGDTILAFMPKKLFEEKLKFKADNASAPMDMVRRKVSKGDASVGGEEMHNTMRGIQTKKDLGM